MMYGHQINYSDVRDVNLDDDKQIGLELKINENLPFNYCPEF